ncbi:unnamed protein product [Notodromas monacha]|uniref:Post-SET domain-containing protein n=1 Tax=Notodromas monacha TaxID=399045 RepID=A0A7R9GDH1_9CRUS|nr:unnamed protein product [Notodromas monacha]CAG0918534.1 unnamed protein product [Notodromas monacha]
MSTSDDGPVRRSRRNHDSFQQIMERVKPTRKPTKTYSPRGRRPKASPSALTSEGDAVHQTCSESSINLSSKRVQLPERIEDAPDVVQVNGWILEPLLGTSSRSSPTSVDSLHSAEDVFVCDTTDVKSASDTVIHNSNSPVVESQCADSDAVPEAVVEESIEHSPEKSAESDSEVIIDGTVECPEYYSEDHNESVPDACVEETIGSSESEDDSPVNELPLEDSTASSNIEEHASSDDEDKSGSSSDSSESAEDSQSDHEFPFDDPQPTPKTQIRSSLISKIIVSSSQSSPPPKIFGDRETSRIIVRLGEPPDNLEFSDTAIATNNEDSTQNASASSKDQSEESSNSETVEPMKDEEPVSAASEKPFPSLDTKENSHITHAEKVPKAEIRKVVENSSKSVKQKEKEAPQIEEVHVDSDTAAAGHDSDTDGSSESLILPKKSVEPSGYKEKHHKRKQSHKEKRKHSHHDKHRRGHSEKIKSDKDKTKEKEKEKPKPPKTEAAPKEKPKPPPPAPAPVPVPPKKIESMKKETLAKKLPKPQKGSLSSKVKSQLQFNQTSSGITDLVGAILNLDTPISQPKQPPPPKIEKPFTPPPKPDKLPFLIKYEEPVPSEKPPPAPQMMEPFLSVPPEPPPEIPKFDASVPPPDFPKVSPFVPSLSTDDLKAILAKTVKSDPKPVVNSFWEAAPAPVNPLPTRNSLPDVISRVAAENSDSDEDDVAAIPEPPLPPKPASVALTSNPPVIPSNIFDVLASIKSVIVPRETPKVDDKKDEDEEEEEEDQEMDNESLPEEQAVKPSREPDKKDVMEAEEIVSRSPAVAQEEFWAGEAVDVTVDVPNFSLIETNAYLTEKKRSKEGKILCDCTLTVEELQDGVVGCGDSCLNRMLLIEWLRIFHHRWTVGGELRVGFFAKKRINAGEEITFDYQLQNYGREAQKCYCGSANCRGVLGSSQKSFFMPRKGSKDIGFYTADDDDLEEEVDALCQIGVKRPETALRVVRLMVRAEDLDLRLCLLRLIDNTEPALQKSYVDYHCLNIIYSWMQCYTPDPNKEDLREEVLSVLNGFNVTHINYVEESKIQLLLEKWCGYSIELIGQAAAELAKESKQQDSEGFVAAVVTTDARTAKLKAILKTPDEDEFFGEEKPGEGEKADIKARLGFRSVHLLNTWRMLPRMFRIPKVAKVEPIPENISPVGSASPQMFGAPPSQPIQNNLSADQKFKFERSRSGDQRRQLLEEAFQNRRKRRVDHDEEWARMYAFYHGLEQDYQLGMAQRNQESVKQFVLPHPSGEGHFIPDPEKCPFCSDCGICHIVVPVMKYKDDEESEEVLVPGANDAELQALEELIPVFSPPKVEDFADVDVESTAVDDMEPVPDLRSPLTLLQLKWWKMMKDSNERFYFWKGQQAAKWKPALKTHMTEEILADIENAHMPREKSSKLVQEIPEPNYWSLENNLMVDGKRVTVELGVQADADLEFDIELRDAEAQIVDAEIDAAAAERVAAEKRLAMKRKIPRDEFERLKMEKKFAEKRAKMKAKVQGKSQKPHQKHDPNQKYKHDAKMKLKHAPSKSKTKSVDAKKPVPVASSTSHPDQQQQQTPDVGNPEQSDVAAETEADSSEVTAMQSDVFSMVNGNEGGGGGATNEQMIPGLGLLSGSGDAGSPREGVTSDRVAAFKLQIHDTVTRYLSNSLTDMRPEQKRKLKPNIDFVKVADKIAHTVTEKEMKIRVKERDLVLGTNLKAKIKGFVRRYVETVLLINSSHARA